MVFNDFSSKNKLVQKSVENRWASPNYFAIGSMYVCTQTHTHAWTAFAAIPPFLWPYICARHTHVHTNTHTHIQTNIHTYINTYSRLNCLCCYTCLSVTPYLCTPHTYTHVHTNTHTHTYIQTNKHTYINNSCKKGDGLLLLYTVTLTVTIAWCSI